MPALRYGTYKLAQKMAGGEKLVAFTRILHRQTPDVLMDEVRGPESRTIKLYETWESREGLFEKIPSEVSSKI